MSHVFTMILTCSILPISCLISELITHIRCTSCLLGDAWWRKNFSNNS